MDIWALYIAVSDAGQGVRAVFTSEESALCAFDEALEREPYGDSEFFSAGLARAAVTDAEWRAEELAAEKALLQHRKALCFSDWEECNGAAHSEGQLVRAFEDRRYDLFSVIHLVKFRLDKHVDAGAVFVVWTSHVAKKYFEHVSIVDVFLDKEDAVFFANKLAYWMSCLRVTPHARMSEDYARCDIPMGDRENIVIQAMDVSSGDPISCPGPYNGHHSADAVSWPWGMHPRLQWKHIRDLELLYVPRITCLFICTKRTFGHGVARKIRSECWRIVLRKLEAFAH